MAENPKQAPLILELRIRHNSEGYRISIYKGGQKDVQMVGPEEKSIVIAWAKRALEEM